MLKQPTVGKFKSQVVLYFISLNRLFFSLALVVNIVFYVAAACK